MRCALRWVGDVRFRRRCDQTAERYALALDRFLAEPVTSAQRLGEIAVLWRLEWWSGDHKMASPEIPNWSARYGRQSRRCQALVRRLATIERTQAILKRNEPALIRIARALYRAAIRGGGTGRIEEGHLAELLRGVA